MTAALKSQLLHCASLLSVDTWLCKDFWRNLEDFSLAKSCWSFCLERVLLPSLPLVSEPCSNNVNTFFQAFLVVRGGWNRFFKPTLDSASSYVQASPFYWVQEQTFRICKVYVLKFLLIWRKKRMQNPAIVFAATSPILPAQSKPHRVVCVHYTIFRGSICLQSSFRIFVSRDNCQGSTRAAECSWILTSTCWIWARLGSTISGCCWDAHQMLAVFFSGAEKNSLCLCVDEIKTVQMLPVWRTTYSW